MSSEITKNGYGKGASPPAQGEAVIRIPLSELHPYPDHPYGIRDDPAMQDTVDSIKGNGVVVTAIVRPRPAGGYEIVAGHRRKKASEQADSNAQREDVLPSERAKANKMRLDAIKRQGARTDITSPNNSAKFRNDDEVGNTEGIKEIVAGIEDGIQKLFQSEKYFD